MLKFERGSSLRRVVHVNKSFEDFGVVGSSVMEIIRKVLSGKIQSKHRVKVDFGLKRWLTTDRQQVGYYAENSEKRAGLKTGISTQDRRNTKVKSTYQHDHCFRLFGK